MFVSCVHRRVVEGIMGRVLPCVLCTLMCMHGVCCVVGDYNVVATEHGRYIVCLVCRNCEQ